MRILNLVLIMVLSLGILGVFGTVPNPALTPASADTERHERYEGDKEKKWEKKKDSKEYKDKKYKKDGDHKKHKDKDRQY